jgi:glutamine amidotransferase
MITIIDYGMGNLGSISNLLSKIGVKSIITSEIEIVKKFK